VSQSRSADDKSAKISKIRGEKVHPTLVDAAPMPQKISASPRLVNPSETFGLPNGSNDNV
jgi:hypothetical protein